MTVYPSPMKGMPTEARLVDAEGTHVQTVRLTAWEQSVDLSGSYALKVSFEGYPVASVALGKGKEEDTDQLGLFVIGMLRANGGKAVFEMEDMMLASDEDLAITYKGNRVILSLEKK